MKHRSIQWPFGDDMDCTHGTTISGRSNEELRGVQVSSSSSQVAYADTSAGCPARVTVVIADNLSSRFAHIFTNASEAKLVGICDPVVDLPDQLVLLQPDVLLLPGDMERRTLLPLLRAIRTHRHPAKVQAQIASGAESNTTAGIRDTESITGNYLT